MPHTMCPLCGETMHVNTGSPTAFERESPELRVLGVAARRCAPCARVIGAESGSRVRIRAHIARRRADRRGRVGTIERHAHARDGALFLVRFDDGEEGLFLVAELELLPT